MYSKKKVAVLILLTFIITSVLYTAAFTLVPSVGGIFGDIRTKLDSGGNLELNSKFNEINGYIDNYFINDYDKNKMSDSAVSAYVEALNDPYTEYITKSKYEEMMSDLSGNYKGIGVEVYIDTENYITVLSVFDDSPAAKAGMLPNDRIIEINGTKVNSENYTEAVNMMRGAGKYSKSDNLRIKILRNSSEEISLSLTRTNVVNQTVKTKMLDNNIGYIRISQFDEDTGKDFDSLADNLITDGAKSLIIDLRNNPGGVLTSVVSVADKILGKGKIITIKDKSGEEAVYRSDEKEIDLPMCVLINGSSASAAEVLAGALRDHKKAVLIGEKSFGKGVVQTIFDLSDKSALKITTAKYYTPNGECIDGKGIEPDYIVKLETDKNIMTLDISEDTQMQKALEILAK